MANTTFVNQSTVIDATWLNDVNDVAYEVLGNGTAVPATKAELKTNLGYGTMAEQNASAVNISGGSIGGITDLAVVDGGTGASTASGARSNLGLVIGTDVASPAEARMQQGTAVNTTSGTAIDFTGIPSTAKELTVVFNAVSSNAITDFLVQIGTSSGIESTGYTSAASSGTTISTATNAFVVTNATSAASNQSGLVKIANLTGNTWCESGTLGLGNATAINVSAGQKALGGVLDRVRITTVSGATFDNGSINLLWK